MNLLKLEFKEFKELLSNSVQFNTKKTTKSRLSFHIATGISY